MPSRAPTPSPVKPSKESARGRITFQAPGGSYVLAPDTGKLPCDGIKIDVSEGEPYHEGMGTSLPMVKVTATKGGKLVVVHLYQPIHTDDGKVFQHHLASFTKAMKGKSVNFSILQSLSPGKLRTLDSHLDKKLEEDGGMEDLIVEIAVWDEAQRRILAIHRGGYGIVAD